MSLYPYLVTHSPPVPTAPPVTGFALWLDRKRPGALWQNTARTVPAGLGDPVASWYDATTNRAAIDDGVWPVPVVGTNGLIWSGVENLQFPRLTGIRTVFWVFAEDADATPGYRSALGDTDGFDFLRADPSPTSRFWWNAGFGSANVYNGTLRVNAIATNGLTTAIPTAMSVCSLVTLGVTAAANLTSDRGSSGRTWDGEIRCVLIYETALTTPEVEATEAWLAARHGVTL